MYVDLVGSSLSSSFREFAVATSVTILLVSWIRALLKDRRAKPNLPMVGRDGFIGTYITAFRFALNQRSVLEEGYAMYKERSFMIPELTGWRIMFSSSDMVNEIKGASEELLSATDATRDVLQSQYTVGDEIHTNPYHLTIIRTHLTRNLETVIPDLLDEIPQAFKSLIPESAKDAEGWISVKGFETVIHIIAQVSNRIFVGAPLCHNSDYIRLITKFAEDVMISATIIAVFPNALKPIVAWVLGTCERRTDAVLKHTHCILEERLASIKEKGRNYEGKPSDLLSWCIDATTGDAATPRNLTRRLLGVNFASLHTTSISLTHVLYALASRPEYVTPLREEVEEAIIDGGWTQEAINSCLKMDSFFKETERLLGLGASTMTRRLMKNHTFVDGSFVPAGATVSVFTTARHRDSGAYGENAHEFDGFRFCRNSENDDNDASHHFVTTSPDFVFFGHGKHSCPGRYFAASEMKAIFAYIIRNFDIKFSDGFTPREVWFGASCIPDISAQLLFRRRFSSSPPL
ncbi:cytochrome P450 [Sistotremastrum suecicum HHB10207 ss-3]|uniref:Cytochrome P450 n=1 Tax=Sistotremastrum suecicum HHB10207 ss-3 TaxID=1314776 RepID=A0A166DYY8_9AGAM|nr:cytochrome P450 [Sistotremastrum suecicum HHB10207 ss-3]